MRRYATITALLIITVLGCCYRAPWVQGPGSFYEDGGLGFAPVWTQDFRDFPAARVDWGVFALHSGIACGLVALIAFGQSLRRSGN